MKIGCPTEIKDNENRIGLTPNAVSAYVAAGHEVFVQRGAGLKSGLVDEEYTAAGAKILASADDVWATADMIVKIKEPLKEEFPKMREGQIVFTYFHFAAHEETTKACLRQKSIALAYETVKEGHTLPLLKPMSEVAGRMAPLMGTFYLAKTYGGLGLLPMGATGVAPAEVLVLGGGVVGTNAARVAAGLGAKVAIMDINLDRLEYLGEIMPPNVMPLYSDPVNLENRLRIADIVIGAVLIPGGATPKLVCKEQLKIMRPGAVLVDVAIDQGGCFETSRPTTHSNPIYEVDGIIHYCVGNMPGAYSRTSTFALNNATLRYGLMLANKGAERACRENQGLKTGLNMYKGSITYQAVAEAFGLMDDYKPVDSVLG
jgi:alanine dehydrogenase